MVHVPGSCGLRGLRALATRAFRAWLFPRVVGGGGGFSGCASLAKEVGLGFRVEDSPKTLNPKP